MIPWLLQGRGDLVMGAMPIDAPRASRAHPTRPYLQTSHVVVARKGRVPAIESVEDLRSATLLVHPSSSVVRRLRQLSSEIGVRFIVSAARETLHAEDMLDEVASGVADCTIVQKRLALVELAYRDNLEIVLELPTGLVQAAFFVRPFTGAVGDSFQNDAASFGFTRIFFSYNSLDFFKSV
jgi:ABC-type amino acid transport substrate-binding protein